LFTDEVPAIRTLIGGGVLLVAIVFLTVKPSKAAPPPGEASATAPMPSAVEADPVIEFVTVEADQVVEFVPYVAVTVEPVH
jgi:hypothetical protein